MWRWHSAAGVETGVHRAFVAAHADSDSANGIVCRRRPPAAAWEEEITISLLGVRVGRGQQE